MQLSETTRDKIMVAAWEVFAEKGYDGARMQEIADRAGANKAMIFYYFSSKDALFEVLIKETFEKMLNSLQSLVADLSLGPKEVLPKIVHTHLSNLAANPNLPKILIREINSGNPVAQKVMAETLSEVGTSSTSPLLTFLQRNIEGGKIRQVDPVQTIWSLVAWIFSISSPRRLCKPCGRTKRLGRRTSWSKEKRPLSTCCFTDCYRARERSHRCENSY